MVMAAIGAGFGTLIALWLLYGILTGHWNPWHLAVGADQRASTSKLQWLLWTIVVIFSYIAIYTARAWNKHFEAIEDIPTSLLVAMGLSAATMTAAKGITVSYVTSGRTVKSSADPPANPIAAPAAPATPAPAAVGAGGPAGTGAAPVTAPPAPAAPSPGPGAGAGAGTAPLTATPTSPKATGPGAIFQDDDGFPDLSKIQMMAWTFIALGTYLITVINEILAARPPGAALPGLPNIAPALVVLTGIGHGAYLGKKLVTTDTPRLTGLSLGSGTPPIDLKISGVAFSDSQSGNLITVDGNPLYVATKSWSDTQIEFTLPDLQWTPGQRITIGVIVGGQESVNRLPFTVQ